MNSFLKMANVQAVLFLYMLVGIYCRKSGIFNDEARSRMTDLVIRITLPCMIFDSFHMEFDLNVLYQGGTALVIATAMAGVALLMGNVLYRRFSPDEGCIMKYGTLVSNAGFAGLPVVSGAYGSQGLFLGSLFIIPTRVLMWSAGISIFIHASAKESFRQVMLNPAIIAVELGMARMILQIPLPSFLDTAVGRLGDSTAPLAMALVGAILADVELNSVWDVKCLYLVAVRQILLPLLCLAVLRLLTVEPMLTGVSVALSGMPIGSTTAILAQKYGANAQFASKCVFISTATSLITVPLLTLLL